MKTVKIFGPGCNRCTETEAMVKEVAERLGVAVDVEKVSDPRSIAMAGVMSTPAVSIDGKLVHAGGLPDSNKIDGWLGK